MLTRLHGKLKSSQLAALIELLLAGAKSRPISITTSELARRLEKSQQAASNHILELEKEGYIERQREGRGFALKITDKGVNELASFYLTLRSMMEETPDMYEFHGYVFTGLGEGAYYMSLQGYKEQFRKKLGFEPYPGTLNLKIKSALEMQRIAELKQREGIRIEGFSDGNRTYGGLKVYSALIEDERGALLAIDRTHYDNSVIEVIAPVRLRDRLSLQENSKVTVKVFLNSSKL
jgi:riboflavin kinase